MKNEESHGSNKQGLQKQADRLLPTIANALSPLGYLDIVHQRLSQQSDFAKTYQGLSRASHDQFGKVMIKWQLSADSSLGLASLNHEIEVSRILSGMQNSNETANENTIAAPILAYETLSLDILEQEQYLALLAMPYYSQGSLALYLKQSLTTEQKQQLIVKAAKTIDSLHQAGWLHNDIKPSNLLINEKYGLLLTDFALSEPIEIDSKSDVQTKHSAGTPAYLAPERWQGQGATVQSDIYAFGIMMVEILMGVRAFKINKQSSDPIIDWATQHCQQPMPVLPLEYSRYQCIVDKALAKRVEKRYRSMDELLEGLERL